MFYHDEDIVKRVSAWIRNRTQENVEHYYMGLYDAFDEAVRSYPKLKKGSKLYKAFYNADYREYIPSAYNPEYLDFAKYPLKY